MSSITHEKQAVDSVNGPSHYSLSEKPGWGRFLVVLYLLIAICPLLIASLFSASFGEPFFEALGKGAALVGFTLVGLQVVLAGRFKFLDRPFGLDMVTFFHQRIAVFAVLLLICHPIFLAIGERSFHLFSFNTGWPVNLGKLTLVVLIFAVLFAMYFGKLGVEYQRWRRLHKFMILIPILGFAHSYWIGTDLQRGAALRAFWWIALAAIAGIFLYRNVAVPLWGRTYRIQSVNRETHDTYTLEFDPVRGSPPGHKPGQFMFVGFRRSGNSSEEHPFTISSSPENKDVLTATIKQSGDFTNTIDKTTTEDTARIEAPYGRYSFLYHQPKSLLFLMGGVGITPAMSMLRHLRDTNNTTPAVLLCGNKTEKDIIFREELAAMPDTIKVVHILSNPPEGWQGSTGYITAEMVKEHAKDILSEADVYLCGPPAMMDKMFEITSELDVGEDRIHFEKFGL
jgi:predicted ferric reductase